MSNTPRTDKAEEATLTPEYDLMNDAEQEAWDFARQLERELDATLRMLRDELGESDDYAASIEALRKDKERLDLLDGLCPKSSWNWSMTIQPDNVYLDKNRGGGGYKTAREAIDSVKR